MPSILLLSVICLTIVSGRAWAQEATRVWLEDDQERHEFVVRIGPVDLPTPTWAVDTSHEGQHDHHAAHAPVFAPVTEVRIPTSAYVYGFDYEIVDGEGRELPRDVLHHLNLINPDNRELFLPISQRMLAVGKETGAQSMPWLLLGYPVPEGMRMVVATMLHNPTGEPHEGVEVRVRLKYVPAGRPWPLLSVYPFQLDIGFPAGDKSVDLPPGRSSFSYEASPAIEGRLMAVGSHLHEYAENIVLEDVTEERVIWEGLPVYDDDSSLVGVTIGRLYRTLGEKIYPDHRYRITVSYNNPFPDTLYDGGMGVVAGVFMPSGGGMWPKADTANALYALDRLHYLRRVRGRYEVIAELVENGEVKQETAPAQGDHEH